MKNKIKFLILGILSSFILKSVAMHDIQIANNTGSEIRILIEDYVNGIAKKEQILKDKKIAKFPTNLFDQNVRVLICENNGIRLKGRNHYLGISQDILFNYRGCLVIEKSNLGDLRIVKSNLDAVQDLKNNWVLNNGAQNWFNFSKRKAAASAIGALALGFIIYYFKNNKTLQSL